MDSYYIVWLYYIIHFDLFFFFWQSYVTSGILVTRPGIKHVPPAVEARSLNHWTPGKSLHSNLNGHWSLLPGFWLCSPKGSSSQIELLFLIIKKWGKKWHFSVVHFFLKNFSAGKLEKLSDYHPLKRTTPQKQSFIIPLFYYWYFSDSPIFIISAEKARELEFSSLFLSY